MTGSGFILDSIGTLYYNLNKISLVTGRVYIDTPEYLKNKNATINPKNNDEKCFQLSIAVAFNHDQFKSHPERISNINPFINQYTWKEIDFPSNRKNWKNFE